MAYSPTTIDLSRVPAPAAIEPLDAEALIAAFKGRFDAVWAAARLTDPSLPLYNVGALETDPITVLAQAWSYLRLLDRARVNDAVRAVLAPLATGADLDAVVAAANVQRLTVIPADGDTPAVMETDAALLRRYLLSFDRPAAGSRDAYLSHAWTAWPSMVDASVVGRAVHGRRGDVDVVISGPGGRQPTTEELAVVRTAVTASHVRPEATSVSVIPAQRLTYAVDLTIHLPLGPDPQAVRQEVMNRLYAATAERIQIGAEVPPEFISGAAYGPSVIRVTRRSPSAAIVSDAYSIPVCTGIQVTVEVLE